MTRIVQEASAVAGAVDLGKEIRKLFDLSDGGRVIALAILKARADPSYFDLLLDGITRSRSAFEQYLALTAMLSVTTLLDPQSSGILRDAISQLSEQEEFFGTDRYAVANEIASQLSGATRAVVA
jgi:hypothetical protein